MIVHAAFLIAFLSAAVAEDTPTYERSVRPLLAKRCTACHNARKIGDPDVSGGLALDSFEAVLKGTAERKVVVPGSVNESELVKRLDEADEERRMPLNDEPLSPGDRELIRRWVDAGAPRGVAAPSTAATTTRRAVVRTLDVSLPVDAKLPKGNGGAVKLALKVGPLPSITALAFRGDGRILAVGTHGAVVLWDLAEGKPASFLTDIPGPAHALTFSRDGKRLAIGAGLPARSGTVRVYSAPDGTLLHDFEGHTDAVFGVAFRPDGGRLATASFDGTVRLWDLAEGREAGIFRGHSDFVYDVAFESDGRTLLSVGKDRAVKRFDAEGAKERRTYSDHDDDVLALAVAPDGSGFVTAGHEPQLRLWKKDGDKPTKKVGGHSGPVHQLAFSADGSRLVSAGGDGSVRLWDGRTLAALKTLPGPTDWQYAAAITPDGTLAAAGGYDGLVRVWGLEPVTLRVTLLQPPGVEPSPEWLAVTPTGVYAASAGLAPLLRWTSGNESIDPEAAREAFDHPERLGNILRGEPAK